MIVGRWVSFSVSGICYSTSLEGRSSGFHHSFTIFFATKKSLHLWSFETWRTWTCDNLHGNTVLSGVLLVPRASLWMDETVGKKGVRCMKIIRENHFLLMLFFYLKMKDVEWVFGWFLWDVFVWMASGEPVIIRRYIEESFSILASKCCLI